MKGRLPPTDVSEIVTTKNRTEILHENETSGGHLEDARGNAEWPCQHPNAVATWEAA